jgi:hypothetical protein
VRTWITSPHQIIDRLPETRGHDPAAARGQRSSRYSIRKQTNRPRRSQQRLSHQGPTRPGETSAVSLGVPLITRNQADFRGIHDALDVIAV